MYRVGSSYLTWKRLCEYSSRPIFFSPSERLAALIAGDFEKFVLWRGIDDGGLIDVVFLLLLLFLERIDEVRLELELSGI